MHHTYDFTVVFRFVFLLASTFEVDAELKTTSALELQIVNGFPATLKCRTTNRDAGIRWTVKKPHREKAVIYTGNKLNDYFKKTCNHTFNVTNRESLLTINTVQDIDAGIYTCIETNTPTFATINFALTVITNEQDVWTTTSITSSDKSTTSAAGSPGDSVKQVEVVLIVSLVVTATITASVFVFILIIRRKKVIDVSSGGRQSTIQQAPAVPVADHGDRPAGNAGNSATLGERGTLSVPPRVPANRSNDVFNAADEPGTANRGSPGNIEDGDDIDPMYAQVAGRRNVDTAQNRTHGTRYV